MSTKNNYRVSSVSYEAIKLEAAELEIEPGVYLNATGTAEKAPYLLRVIPKEKLELDAFCQAVAKLTGHTFEETRRENDIRMEVIAAAAAEGYTYIDTGYITFDLRIAGSIDSTTAVPTREANPVYLAAYPSRDLAASLAAITAKLSKTAAPFKIDTVWGKDSHDRFVTSGGVFQVNGTGFDNPTVMLVFASGTKSPAEVESWKPTYIRATAPSGEDVKTMTLEVTCETKDGTEMTLEKPNVPFKFVSEPIDPTAPRLTGYSVNKQPVEKLPADAVFAVLGERLEAFNCSTGTSKLTATFTAGPRAGTSVPVDYSGVSSSPRYDSAFNGVYVASPELALAAGEKGSFTIEIDGKKSNALAFEVE